MRACQESLRWQTQHATSTNGRKEGQRCAGGKARQPCLYPSSQQAHTQLDLVGSRTHARELEDVLLSMRAHLQQPHIQRTCTTPNPPIPLSTMGKFVRCYSGLSQQHAAVSMTHDTRSAAYTCNGFQEEATRGEVGSNEHFSSKDQEHEEQQARVATRNLVKGQTCVILRVLT